MSIIKKIFKRKSIPKKSNDIQNEYESLNIMGKIQKNILFNTKNDIKNKSELIAPKLIREMIIHYWYRNYLRKYFEYYNIPKNVINIISDYSKNVVKWELIGDDLVLSNNNKNVCLKHANGSYRNVFTNELYNKGIISVKIKIVNIGYITYLYIYMYIYFE